MQRILCSDNSHTDTVGYGDFKYFNSFNRFCPVLFRKFWSFLTCNKVFEKMSLPIKDCERKFETFNCVVNQVQVQVQVQFVYLQYTCTFHINIPITKITKYRSNKLVFINKQNKISQTYVYM